MCQKTQSMVEAQLIESLLQELNKWDFLFVVGTNSIVYLIRNYIFLNDILCGFRACWKHLIIFNSYTSYYIHVTVWLNVEIQNASRAEHWAMDN